jgi:Rho-binding antiterminator
MSLSFTNSELPPVSCETQTLLREYLNGFRLAEVIYRDDAGQIQTTHDTIRDLFSRAGRDFVCLSRGQVLRLDHILTLDGHPVASPSFP